MEDNKNNTQPKTDPPQAETLNEDEILVKGTDGKWYLLRGEELAPYESGLAASSQRPTARDLPKGVTQEVHQKLEAKMVPIVKSSITPVRPVAVSHEGHPLVKELEELIDQAVAESQKMIQAQIPPWDAVLQKRFRTLVSARLRDVRDTLETKSLLARDIKIGGMGLKEVETQTLSTIIEAKFKEFDQKWRTEEAKKRANWQKKQIEDSGRRQDEQKLKEIEEMERRHQMLVGRAGMKNESGIRNQESGVLSVTRVSELKIEAPKVVKKTELPKPPAPPLVRLPSPQPSPTRGDGVAMKSPPVISGEETKTRSPLRGLRQLGPSSTPAGEGKGEGRPKVIDVKFTPRLLSPIEELREMNLIDFRRLGRDAAEIMFKIKAKIDLLGEESFVKKTEGVAAWKQSEPAKLYTTLSTIALTFGQPVSVIIAEREKKGEKTLTVDEFRGIMELVKNLRF